MHLTIVFLCKAICYVGLLTVLFIPKAYNAVYFCLLLLSIAFLYDTKKKIPKEERTFLIWTVILIFYLLPFLLSVIFNGDTFTSLDKPLMLFATITIFILSKEIKLNLSLVQKLLHLSVGILYLVLWTQNGFNSHPDRLTLQGVNPVAFAYALLGLYSLQLSLKTSKLTCHLMKIISLSLTFSLIILTGTRMAIIGTLITSIIYVFVALSKKYILITILFGSIFVITIGLSNPTLKSRILTTKKELNLAFNQENYSTSLGYRFAMWHSAYLIGTQNLLLGAGEEGHKIIRAELISKKIVDPGIKRFSQYHNAIFDAFAKRGVPGALSVLLLLITPVFFFLKKIKYYSQKKQYPQKEIVGFLIFFSLFLCSLTDNVLISNYVIRTYVFFFFCGYASSKSQNSLT